MDFADSLATHTGGSVGFVILKSAQAVGGKVDWKNPTGRISVGFGHGFKPKVGLPMV